MTSAAYLLIFTPFGVFFHHFCYEFTKQFPSHTTIHQIIRVEEAWHSGRHFFKRFFFCFSFFFFFQYSRFPFKEGKQFLIFSLQVSFSSPVPQFLIFSLQVSFSSPVPNPPSHSRLPNVFIYRRSDPIGGTLEVASRYSVDPSPEAASPPTWVGV
jgi:hypothetical protein